MGFYTLLSLGLGLMHGAFIMCAPPCSLFGYMSSSFHKRAGDTFCFNQTSLVILFGWICWTVVCFSLCVGLANAAVSASDRLARCPGMLGYYWAGVGQDKRKLQSLWQMGLESYQHLPRIVRISFATSNDPIAVFTLFCCLICCFYLFLLLTPTISS